MKRIYICLLLSGLAISSCAASSDPPKAAAQKEAFASLLEFLDGPGRAVTDEEAMEDYERSQRALRATMRYLELKGKSAPKLTDDEISAKMKAEGLDVE